MDDQQPLHQSKRASDHPGSGAPALILVKHALPAIDPATPAPEWPLNAEGRRRAALLRERLRAYGPARIATSPEPKAAETARLIASEDVSPPIVVVPDLREHERRQAGFLSTAIFHGLVERSLRHPDDLVFGEETATAARVRFTAAVNRLLAETPAGQSLIVVAHGTVISLFVAHLAGTDPVPLWRRLGLPSFVVLARPDLSLIEVVDDITGDTHPPSGPA